MYTLLPATFISLLLAPRAYAFRIEDVECYTDLCLQSLRWCEVRKDPHDCYFPENVYPMADYAGPPPALVWEREYEVKWTRKDQETPVTIRLSFFREEGQERSEFGADWEHNVTDGSTSFIFKPSRSMFPNDVAPNISSPEAVGLAKQQATIRIEQFSDPNNISSSTNARDDSDPFTIITWWDIRYMDYANQKLKDERNRDLKLALGLGIPLTFLVAWLLASLSAWLWSKRRVAKEGEKGMNARKWWLGF